MEDSRITTYHHLRKVKTAPSLRFLSLFALSLSLVLLSSSLLVVLTLAVGLFKLTAQIGLLGGAPLDKIEMRGDLSRTQESAGLRPYFLPSLSIYRRGKFLS